MVVDVPLFHLDRPFTYRVPESLRDAVRLGSRVKVPFGARRRVDGWVVGFTDELPPGARDLIRLVSPLPVYGPRELALLRWVADRWAGTLSDVLRLAVPPRVAAVEAAFAEADGGSGGLESEAGTQAADGHAKPSGSPPVDQGSGGLKSEAGAQAAGGHAKPSGSPRSTGRPGPPGARVPSPTRTPDVYELATVRHRPAARRPPGCRGSCRATGRSCRRR